MTGEYIINFLNHGKNNALTRDALVSLTGLSDGTVRDMIKDARDNGYLIINDQDGEGYYLSDDIDAIHRQYKQDTARAMSILKRRKHSRKLLKEAGRAV